jgi:hypothetical protein
MRTLQLPYEAPMLVDLEDLAAEDSSWCIVCSTGGGSVAGTGIGFDVPTPFDSQIQNVVGTVANAYYDAWPTSTTAPPPFPITTG